MLVDDAHKLVREAKRTTASALPPYNSEIVRSATRSIRSLHTAVGRTLTMAAGEDEATPSVFSPDSANAHLLVLQLSALRAKRCLLSYHMHRVDVMRTRAWQNQMEPSRATLDNTDDPDAVLSPSERQFLAEYTTLVREHAAHYPSLQLTSADATPPPPREPFVDVRVVRDCGAIITEHGTVQLQIGTQHHLRRVDVAHWLAAGNLVQIDER